MSDEENKTRATTGVKFSAFKQVGPQEGNPVEVVGLRDGENVRAPLTTDLIETNPGITFRNAKGQFASPDPGVTELTNQLKVNRYLYDRMVESGVTIDVAPPDIYADGTFWFCNSESSMQLFVYHEESDAWIPVAPPATIADRVAAGEDIQSGILEAVGELETKVTALEGAVGEHSLIFNPDRPNPRAGEFVVKDAANQVVNTLSGAKFIYIAVEDRNGGSIAVDRITPGDVMRLSDIGGVTAELKIKQNLDGGLFEMEKLFGDLDRLSEYPYDFNLFSSFDPAGLATTDYVDARVNSKIGRNAIWTLGDSQPWELRQKKTDGTEKSFIKIYDGKMNLTNVGTPGSPSEAATKAYVDQEVSRALGSLSQVNNTPTQFSWLYGGESEWYPSSYAFFTDGNSYKLSLKPYNGDAGNGPVISKGTYKEWNAAGGGAIEMSFWYRDGGDKNWAMLKHVEIDKVYWMESQGGVTYMRFHRKWQSNSNSFSNNKEYFITVGGFF